MLLMPEIDPLRTLGADDEIRRDDAVPAIELHNSVNWLERRKP